MKEKGVWSEVDVEEAWKVTGKAPMTVKWVDTNKGTPRVRSRLVARDFKRKGEKDQEDLFAATPPLELKRMLMSKTASGAQSGKSRKLLFVDVKKAHIIPICDKDVYFEIPVEANPGDGKCGKLRHWLYGFRPAAQAWDSHYAANFVGEGFQRGRGASVVFWHADRDVACVVHGDDFTFSGFEEDLNWVEGLMKKWFDVKVRARLGPQKDDDKEITILGRTVRWEKWGIEYEADPKHREIVMGYFGFDEKSKGWTSNGKADEAEKKIDDEPLLREEATAFRALAARINFLAQDRPDIQFPAKEICRDMAVPTRNSWTRMKRVAKYLVSHNRVVFQYFWQDEGRPMMLFADSDWAGCRKTRKSTSGGAIMIGGHCIKVWSHTQGPIALSSAEAEYYAMVEGVSRAKGLQAMAREIGLTGMDQPITLSTDSSAAKSFASRRGLGRMRHVETRHLWLQEEVLARRVVVAKVRGEGNPADIATKYLSTSAIETHLKRMNIKFAEERPRRAAREIEEMECAAVKLMN